MMERFDHHINAVEKTSHDLLTCDDVETSLENQLNL